ncbi:hypothetical protein Tco_1568184 [Tanacetum coccineum]
MPACRKCSYNGRALHVIVNGAIVCTMMPSLISGYAIVVAASMANPSLFLCMGRNRGKVLVVLTDFFLCCSIYRFLDSTGYSLYKPVSVSLSFYGNDKPYDEEYARETINMLQELRSARSLTLSIGIVEIYYHTTLHHSKLVYLNIDSGMSSDAYKVKMSTEARNFLLENSLNATFIMQLPEPPPTKAMKAKEVREKKRAKLLADIESDMKELQALVEKENMLFVERVYHMFFIICVIMSVDDDGDDNMLSNSDNSSGISDIKFSFIDGTCKRKSDDPVLANQWDLCNFVVVTWVLNSFLMGLDDVYQPIRSNILTREPLPFVKIAFAIVSGEESHRNIICSKDQYDRIHQGRSRRSVPSLTHQRPQQNEDQYAYPETQYAEYNILEDIKRGPYSKKSPIRRDLDNETNNVLIPLDSWTSGLLVYRLPLSGTKSRLRPYHFNYPKRSLTMEEMLNKFIDEGKREHEEMRAFIYDFQTNNLFKERNNSLIKLRFGVQELLNVINNVLTINCDVKGVTTRGGKATTLDVRDNNTVCHQKSLWLLN